MREQREIILENAIILIECGEVECLFEALGKAAGRGWNGGFGTDDNIASWDDGSLKRTSHEAYAAVRLALPNQGQALMCFSQSASSEEKIAVLKQAKEVEFE